jgi:hypothetical protein
LRILDDPEKVDRQCTENKKEDKERTTSKQSNLTFEITSPNYEEEPSMIDPKDNIQIRKALTFYKTLFPVMSGDSTLKRARIPSDEENAENSGTKNIFISTMTSFLASQTSQLVTDLCSNTKKGDTTHAHIVESNFLNAAKYLLQPDTSPHHFTLEVALEVHRLTTNQLLDSAGVLRNSKGARAGTHHFPPPSRVLPLLRTFLELLQTHVHSLVGGRNGAVGDALEIELVTDDTVREACTLAGWAGYNYLHIHPFSDGNGRTVSSDCLFG